MILQPDDMSVGLFVTVLDIKEEKTVKMEEGNPYLNSILSMASGGDAYNSPNFSMFKMLKGAVLRIDAINLPYIIITAFEHGDNTKNILGKISKMTMPLDTRKLAFTKVSNEYVIAYLGKSMIEEFLREEDYK